MPQTKREQKPISRTMINEFLRHKREGWSNEVAAKKAGFTIKLFYELLEKEPHIGEYCAQFFKLPNSKKQAERIYLRRIRKLAKAKS